LEISGRPATHRPHRDWTSCVDRVTRDSAPTSDLPNRGASANLGRDKFSTDLRPEWHRAVVGAEAAARGAEFRRARDRFSPRADLCSDLLLPHVPPRWRFAPST
jgi:hypothetical protein